MAGKADTPMLGPLVGDLVVAGQTTRLAQSGTGRPVLLLHGSGPGVSGMANWSGTLPALAAAGFQGLAPDLLGFGGTVPPEDAAYTLAGWAEHALGVLDELGLPQVDLVGNSFGGAVALRLAAEHPDRVRRLVLMGSVGVRFALTDALDQVWGYSPSLATMAAIMRLFAFDSSLVSADLAQERYQASIADGAAERFARMFPAPRQRWIDAMAATEAQLERITAPTLLVHGRDDRVIPLETSLTLLHTLAHAELHVFGECGHWTQIERRDDFNALLVGFLQRDPHRETKESNR